ncbi:MAG: hypothetical protein HQM09_19315 [Candidatus Riflebacteria bacterium]|nr:hypothetical protein [Candidatus Riflebacteria bacterium]
MNLRFATRIAIAGVMVAMMIDLAYYWYFSDQLLALRTHGKITVEQFLIYTRAISSAKSIFQNCSLGYFFYALQSKLKFFGEIDPNDF